MHGRNTGVLSHRFAQGQDDVNLCFHRPVLRIFVGAVAAVGVAAVAALEVVGGGEDEVGAVEVEVLGG